MKCAITKDRVLNRSSSIRTQCSVVVEGGGEVIWAVKYGAERLIRVSSSDGNGR